MPALLAVHESAPDDPSVPLQRAHPQPQEPPLQGPQAFQAKGKTTPSAKPAERVGKQATTSKAKRASADSSQQDESTQTGGSTIADGDGDSDDGNSSSSTSSGATDTPGWGFKTARPPGYRQKIAQTPGEQQAGPIAAEDKQEARLQEWPHLWYPPQQLIGQIRDSEFADEQRLVAEQILQQKQQQGLGETEAARQDAQDTSTAGSDFQTATILKPENLQSDRPRQSAEQDLQHPAANLSLAGVQDATASGYLPKLDLLAQFSESDNSTEGLTGDTSGDASAAEEIDAAPTTDQHSVPGHADSNEGESRMVVNLNGAQVLTPDGWQSMPSTTPLGTAWEQGNCLTIGMTLQYHMSASSGQITAVTCGWATLDAFAWTIQDVMDLYIRCTGLHRW